MAEFPDFVCRNPSCPSVGQSHPNCRCGAPGTVGSHHYAEGGDIGDFYCSTDRPHLEGCQYLAEGGEAAPSWDSLSSTAPSPSENQAPNWDELSPTPPSESSAPDWNSLSDSPPETSQYSTPSQELLTGVEGAAQGLGGPLATAVELGLSKLGVPGISAQDIAGRAEANPGIHGVSEAGGLAAGMLTGTGEAALASKAAQGVAQAVQLGKVGSTLLKGAVEFGGIQAGDEITKALLGQGNPETPVSAALAHIGAASLLGGTGAGIFGAIGAGAEKGFTALENAKLGSKADSFLRGIGAHALGIGAEDLELPPANMAAFKAGEKVHEQWIKSAGDAVGNAVAKGVAYSMSAGVLGYEALQEVLSKVLKPVGNKAITYVDKYVPAIASKAWSAGHTTGMFNLLDYASSIGKGAQKMNKGIESLFNITGQQSINEIASERDKQKLKDFIEQGGVQKQIQNEAQTSQGAEPTPMPSFAEGGEVSSQSLASSNPISDVYPEQNILLQTARGRISNYLNSIRPQPPMNSLPYDKTIKDPMKEKRYDKALDIALKPLSVLNHIKNGTIQPEHVQHLTSMYPEIYSNLSSRITKRMLEGKVDKEEAPSYKVRQAMSMFLGSPLDSTMTSQGITTAQTVFAKGTQPAQKPPSPKSRGGGNNSPINKLPNQYQTPLQSAQQRATRTD